MSNSRGIALRRGTLFLLPSEDVLFLLVRVYPDPSVLVLLLETPDMADVYDVEDVDESMLDDEGPRERCSFSPVVERLRDEEDDEGRRRDRAGTGGGSGRGRYDDDEAGDSVISGGE